MENRETVNLLSQPLPLPCGAELKNRLIKSAMSDSLGDGGGNPTDAQIRLYERWAEGGAAMSLIGEVQISPFYPEKPGNLVLRSDADLATMARLAQSGSKNAAQIWPQLGHAGALAHGPISDPKGPSPLDVTGLKCEGMSLDEIRVLPRAYAEAATLAKNVGFGGVMIHAGHGFLFSQFLSPLFNHRTDEYGGSIENRFRIIGEVIDAVRRVVGGNYPIAIKINSTDKLEGGLTTDDALNVVRLLNETSIDLIDVSGGTYFPGAASSSDGVTTSGPYFVNFAKQAKELTSIPIALTGGFETRAQAAEVLKEGSADAISLARAMALDPSLANNWLSEIPVDPEFPTFESPPRGGVTAWYSMLLTALGEDKEDAFNLSPKQALDAYEARDAVRCENWRQRFG